MRKLSLLALSAATLLACGEWFGPPLDPPLDSGPVLWMWVGPKDEAPPCVDGQPPKWEGWMPQGSPDSCEPCTCGPAACTLPSRVSTNASACPGGGRSIEFGAGAGWDGTCATPASPVEPGEFASVVYEPPTLSPCTPSKTPEPPPAPALFVRVCAGNTAQDPPGFVDCMQASKEGTCRDGLTRHEFFEALIDDRACAPCECGPPAGGKCVANVSLYGDGACGAQVDAALSISAGDIRCTDIDSTLALVALRAELVEAEPGACAASVPAVIGDVEGREPRVVCSFP
ncbi:hypothetical protein WMF18_36105 [Sorangium sp. So ce315]|uniref:hypothetical protein n=1 Tax=Sorangium sp. So ce315 TaxID=3133299 RepID=UPI003F61A042